MKFAQFLLLHACLIITSACGNEPASPPTAPSSSADDTCDDVWRAFVGQIGKEAVQSVDSMIAKWGQSKSECAGSDVFNIRLAGLYFRRGDLEQARALLSAAVPQSEIYKEVREIYLLRIQVQESVQRNDSMAQIMSLVENDFVRLYSNDVPSCASDAAMSEYSIQIEKFDRAAEAADRAVSCEPTSAAWVRGAALANGLAGRYQAASKYCSDAFDLSRNLMFDQRFMLSCANSYIEIQDLKTANLILTHVRNKLPNAALSPEFSRLQRRASSP